MKTSKRARRVRRVVLGEGHPWYCGSAADGGYAEIRLYKEPLAESILFRQHRAENVASLNPGNTGNWNKIRLVAEVLE